MPPTAPVPLLSVYTPLAPADAEAAVGFTGLRRLLVSSSCSGVSASSSSSDPPWSSMVVTIFCRRSRCIQGVVEGGEGEVRCGLGQLDYAVYICVYVRQYIYYVGKKPCVCVYIQLYVYCLYMSSGTCFSPYVYTTV